MRPRRSLALVFGSLFLLSCGSGGSPSAHSNLSDNSKLRFDGIGPVKAGMTLDEASEAAGTPVEVEDDSADGCTYASADDGPEGLSFMVNRDKASDPWRIVRVDVEKRPVETEDGIAVGATEADVEDAYKDGDTEGDYKVEGHKYVEGGHYITFDVDGDGGNVLLFETDGKKVTSFRSGYEEQVGYVEHCL